MNIILKRSKNKREVIAERTNDSESSDKLCINNNYKSNFRYNL